MPTLTAAEQYDLKYGVQPADPQKRKLLKQQSDDEYDRLILSGQIPQRERLLPGPPVPEPAQAGFFESLAGVPEQVARLLASTNPAFAAREAGRYVQDIAMAEQGDLDAAKRLRAKGLTLSGLAAAIPVGPPVAGVGRALLSTLGRRAALGAAGGAAAGGLEAGVSGQEILPAVAGGGAVGALVGPAAGGVGYLLARRAAARLAGAGKAATPELAAKMAETAAGAPVVTPAPTTPTSRVLAALEIAPRLLGRQERLRAAELGVRVARAQRVATETAGEAGFRSEVRQLAGEYPKVDFESIRSAVSQDDMDALFDMVKGQPGFDFFDRLHAREGLAKLFGEFGGKIPTESELKLLNKVFGEEFVKTVQSKRGLLAKMLESGYHLANLPRSFMASFDLSSPLRQGLFLAGGAPKQFGRAFAQMFRYFGSEKAFQGLVDDISARPTFFMMKRSGLALSDLSHFLSSREEHFLSNWAEKIPVLGAGVRASARAYTGFLDKLRADVFDDLVKQAHTLGLDPSGNATITRDIANFINTATGRGESRFLEKHAGVLNSVLFSPRLMASRLQLLNPVYYARLEPFVRRQALKSLFSLAAASASVMQLARLAGADVEPDPESPDFAKIKIGNTRYDILGGFQQYIRLGYRLIRGPSAGNRLDMLARFAENKAAPLVTFATGLLRGTAREGQPFNVPEEIGKRFVPLVMQDAWQAMKEWGPEGIGVAAPALFGVGVQTYE